MTTHEDFEAALSEESFDAILADNLVPSREGLTAQGIAALWAPDVPFIFVSGTLGDELGPEQMKNGRRLIASGAAAYLTKPVVIGEVLAVLDRTLSTRSRAIANSTEVNDGA